MSKQHVRPGREAKRRRQERAALSIHTPIHMQVWNPKAGIRGEWEHQS